MNNSRWLKATVISFVLCVGFSSPQIRGQSVADSSARQAIETLVSSPMFPSKSEANTAAEALLKNFNKSELAKSLTDLAVSHELDINMLYAGRMLGSHLAPDYESCVTHALNQDISPFAKGRLLLLLRNAKQPLDQALVPLLQDKRPAEKLTPRRFDREGNAYRVCDVAFNVIREIRGEALLLDHYSSADERDKIIHDADLTHPGDQHDPGPTSIPIQPSPDLPSSQAPPPPSIPAPPAPKTPSAPARGEPKSATPWVVLAGAIIAAVGLVWLSIKKRK